MKIQHGPATVTDDERRMEGHCPTVRMGRSRQVGRLGSQDTKRRFTAFLRGKAKPHSLQGPASSRDGLFLLGTLTMANRLILVRHARPAADYVGRLVGATDPPLDAAGHEAGPRPGRRIRRLDPGRCYCSPLKRCRQTAAAIAGDLPSKSTPTCARSTSAAGRTAVSTSLKVEEPAAGRPLGGVRVRLRFSRRRKRRRVSRARPRQPPTDWLATRPTRCWP